LAAQTCGKAIANSHKYIAMFTKVPRAREYVELFENGLRGRSFSAFCKVNEGELRLGRRLASRWLCHRSPINARKL
jgi:hypothetical protein